MSLNGSFFKGGWGGGEENKSCNVVPMQLLTSRVQPGCSGHRLFSSCFVCFVFVFFLPRVRCAGHGVRQGV